MKMQLLFSIVFFTLLVILLTAESIVLPPVIVLSLFLRQQSVLSEYEALVMAWGLGIVIAVLYSMPLAVGIACVAGVTFFRRMQWWQSYSQTRDELMALVACSVIGIVAVRHPTGLQVLGFLLYFGSVILAARLLARRQMLSFKQK